MTATPSQQQAIDENGHCLVVAGPGSGKTKTLVAKILRLLSENSSARLVAVTFTRDAAQELKSRVSKACSAPASRLQIGTFHSLTIRHLKQCGKQFKIASPAQQRMYLRRAAEQHAPNLEYSEVLQRFEAAKGTLYPSSETLEIQGSDWFSSYTRHLESLQMVDLYDVMLYAAKGFRDGKIPPLPCTHLFVDEGQDNDQVQFEWVRAHRSAVTTVVCDDDQTIYEWRRAVGYLGMLDFQNEREASKIVLDQNFRSKAEIVNASLELIRNNAPYRNEKSPVATRGAGGCVQVHSCHGFKSQCEDAVQLLLEKLNVEHPGENEVLVPTGSWAVLARTNGMLLSIESQLSAAKIRSFRSTGSIWEHPAAQGFLHTLLAVATSRVDSLDASLAFFGFPSSAIENIVKCAAQQGEDISQSFSAWEKLDGKSCEKFTIFQQQLGRWRRFYKTGRINMLLEQVSEQSITHLKRSERASGETIIRFALERVQARQEQVVTTVEYMLRETSNRTPENSVLLYTMHGSKGLEFDNVVLIGIDDKSIPGSALDLAPGDPQLVSGATSVASERRLLYVAMTRAKDALHIFHTASEPSRFISEFRASAC